MNIIVSISIVALIILIIAFIGAGMWFKRMATTAEDFLLAGRNAPFWLLATAYLGGYVGGASVSGYVGLGFGSGISAMWASIFVVTGSVVFILLFSRRLNYFGRKTKAVTIADFVCERFGESMRLPTSIVALTRPAILTGMQFLAISASMKVVFGTSIEFGVIVSSLIILLYLITAGQYSALITQWFQSILQSAGIILFALVAFKLIGNPTEVSAAFHNVLPESFNNFMSLDMSIFTVYAFTFGLFYLADPWMYMWAYVGESPRVSSNGMLAVLGGSYYNVLPFLGGMAILVGASTGKILVPDGLMGDSLYAWLTTNFSGTIVGVIILTGLMMTIISCGSSFAMNGVTILTRDIYQRVINKNASDKQVLFASRVSLVVVVFIGIASALWLPILVPLWALAQAIGLSGLFATTMSAWFWKRATTAGAMASTVGGALVAFGWALYAWKLTGSPGGLVYGLHAVHVGIATSIPLVIIVSLATKPDYSKALATNWKVLGEELKTTDLVAEIDKPQRPGFFGWLCADTIGWKVFWVGVTVIFALHYVLSFLFHIPAMTLMMVWICVIIGVGMVFMLAALGGRDIYRMARAAKNAGNK